MKVLKVRQTPKLNGFTSYLRGRAEVGSCSGDCAETTGSTPVVFSYPIWKIMSFLIGVKPEPTVGTDDGAIPPALRVRREQKADRDT